MKHNWFCYLYNYAIYNVLMFFFAMTNSRYRCYSYVLEGCSAGIVEDDDGIFVPTGPPHYHANHKREIHQMMLVQAIRVRLHNEPRSIKEIYDEEVERYGSIYTYIFLRPPTFYDRKTMLPPTLPHFKSI
jgi:hypothetical protein